MPVLTQKDLAFLLGELERFTADEPDTIADLVRTASAWLRTIGSMPGLGDVLVRDVTSLCSYALGPRGEARRLAAGALAFILRAEGPSDAGLAGRHLAAGVALNEIRRRCGQSSGYDPPEVRADEKARAEAIFLGHAEEPLFPDDELVVRAKTFCDELAPLAGTPFIARLVRGVRLLVETLERNEGQAHDERTWARAGLSYVLRTDDSIDNRLGLAGLLDDVYVVETAVRFIEPERVPLNNLLSALFSAWPFLLDVLFEEGGIAQPASEFLLLNAAFSCCELVEDTSGPPRLAVVSPGTGPVPFLVGLLAALGEQLGRVVRPRERFEPGQLVLVEGDACAIYRGRHPDPAGALRIVLEQPGRGKRAGTARIMIPLWAESSLTLAPSVRKPTGTIASFRSAASRPLSALQRLFHLAEPISPDGAAKKIIVITDQAQARSLAESVSLYDSPLPDVIPIGHLNRNGGITSWSESAFGAQEPLLIAASVAERAVAFVEAHPEQVGLVVIDHGKAAAEGEVRRLMDAKVPLLAFIPDDDTRSEMTALFGEYGTRTWTWLEDDMRQLVWRDSRGRGAIADFEHRVRASVSAGVSPILIGSEEVSDADGALTRFRRSRRDQVDDTRADELLSEAYGVFLDLIRAIEVLTDEAFTAIEERLARIERVAKADRFLSDDERLGLGGIVSALRRLGRALATCNPKADALAALLKENGDLQVLSTAPAGTDSVDPAHGAVLTAWLGRKRMRSLLVPPIASPLHLLLYTPELRWFHSAEVYRRVDRRYAEGATRGAIFPRLGLIWRVERQPENAPPPSLQHDAVADFDAIRAAIFNVRGRRALGHADFDSGETVQTTMVVFRERAFAFLTEGYDVNVVTHLLLPDRGGTGAPPAVRVRRPEQLRIGDVLLFPEGDRDAIREYADRVLPPGERERAKLWQRVLRRWSENRGLTTRIICDRLGEKGCVRHPVTIRNWLMNEGLIGPGHEGDLRVLAELTEDPELLASLEECERAVKAVRGAHLHAASQLAAKVAARAAARLAERGSQTVKLDDVYLVTVEHLDVESRAVPRGGTNRLIFDPDDAEAVLMEASG